MRYELSLPIHVVKGGGPNLMGPDWISQFEVNLKVINPPNAVQNLLDKSVPFALKEQELQAKGIISFLPWLHP